jgi:L-cysteate sulfo-lyase
VSDLARRLAAGLIALVQADCWAKDDDVIFIYTGGAPALFAYSHLFQD